MQTMKSKNIIDPDLILFPQKILFLLELEMDSSVSLALFKENILVMMINVCKADGQTSLRPGISVIKQELQHWSLVVPRWKLFSFPNI